MVTGVASRTTSPSDSSVRRSDCHARELSKQAGGAVAALVIVPGDGAGLDCLGERLTPDEPCETNAVGSICRRFREADERQYEHGVLARIRIHRRGRIAPSAFKQGPVPFRSPRYQMKANRILGEALGDVLQGQPAPTETRVERDPDFGPITRYFLPGLEIEAERVEGREIVGAVVVVAK